MQLPRALECPASLLQEQAIRGCEAIFLPD
jgi:hypothetical protein